MPASPKAEDHEHTDKHTSAHTHRRGQFLYGKCQGKQRAVSELHRGQVVRDRPGSRSNADPITIKRPGPHLARPATTGAHAAQCNANMHACMHERDMAEMQDLDRFPIWRRQITSCIPIQPTLSASQCGRTYIYLQTHFYIPTSMHAFEHMRAPIMPLSHQYRPCTIIVSLNTDSSGRRPASCQVHDATTHINRNSRPKDTGQAAGPDCYFQD